MKSINLLGFFVLKTLPETSLSSGIVFIPKRASTFSLLPCYLGEYHVAPLYLSPVNTVRTWLGSKATANTRFQSPGPKLGNV